MSAPRFTATSFPVHVYLARNRREWNALCRHYEVSFAWPGMRPTAPGMVLTLKHMVYVAVFSLDECDAAETAGVLAHEALHILQYILRDVNEVNCGAETEAYTVQALVEWMYKIVVDGAVN